MMSEATCVQEATLCGRLVVDTGSALLGQVHPETSLTGAVSKPVDHSEYAGTYEVSPRVFTQTLPTMDKHLSKDVTVKPIPYYEVDNPQKGQTIIIGGN